MKTILLIDDDWQVRSMFGLALRRSGYRVIEADFGVAGLEMAWRHLPDLILSDIYMPGGDGSTFLRDIRRDPELKSRQVVLMTGRPDLVTPRKGMEEGADDFLVKPVSLEALRSCVAARFSRASISWRVEDRMLAELRSSVLSNLPHECFTPLAGIVGLMEILLSDNPGLAPEELRDIYRDVYQSALRLHRTLRNYLLILDLQGTPSEAPPPLPPSEVGQSVRAGVDEALRQYKRRDDVTVRVSTGSIAVRPGNLTRMVEELVDNACKFSRQGSSVKVDFDADGRLIVSDEGRGLTVEEIGQIGAFHQFDCKKTNSRASGSASSWCKSWLPSTKPNLRWTASPARGCKCRSPFPWSRARKGRQAQGSIASPTRAFPSATWRTREASFQQASKSKGCGPKPFWPATR